MFYKLSNKKPIPVPLQGWADAFDNESHIVARIELPDKKLVSTIFLGIDHNHSAVGPPLLFETMVFDNADNFNEIDCVRCSTWEKAEKQHEEMVRKWTNHDSQTPS